MTTDPSWSEMTIGHYRAAAIARLNKIDPQSTIGQCLATLSPREQVNWLCKQVMIGGKYVERYELPDDELVSAWEADNF